MEKMKAFLNQKVAGVPVVLIAALVMAGLLYMAIRTPSTVEDEIDVDEDYEDVPAGDTLGDTDQPVFSATPVIYQPSGGSVASAPQEDTNELWGRRAIEFLIQQGNTVDESQGAIQAYLSGAVLSMAQSELRDKAVKQFGLPPETFEYGGTKTPKDQPYKGPFVSQGEPPLTHVVKGKSDDTPKEIAIGYYGLATDDAVNKIKAANTTKGDGPWAPGTEIRVPEKFRPRYYKATAATRTVYAIARKNGTTPDKVVALNPDVNFPVKVGKRVRVK